MALYDRAGGDYDRTRRADPAIVARLLDLLDLPAGGRCLDIACGTGNYTAALGATGIDVTGIDQSAVMLAAARVKLGLGRLVTGDAARLPFAERTFAGAICTLALHHFADLDACCAEAARVLRPGARLVLFTADPEQVRHYWLTRYFPGAMAAAAAELPPVARVRSALRAGGFASVDTHGFEVTAETADLFLYSGKHRPERYLDPSVRQGISTFRRLEGADEAELTSGLARLAADIKTGAIGAVIAAHQHPDGDYLFVRATR
jgi:ubiquinone/menaquinone biosynthesis C-methylase UbiE